ncbi:MAG: type II toxin-antitoxin system RelB/DinJ family antitoxin [Thermoguttaceae bacterium]|nr:type II toxin-antitoxin system RelB/DinJ family antitoxin [Thermoguttaceae bacterium]
MATLQIRLSDDLKARADELFVSLGLDTSTAVRIFLTSAIENGGLPFPVRRRSIPAELRDAIRDARNRENLNGPYGAAREAVEAMLEE